MNIQILRVHHYGDTEADDRRITISPINVIGVAAEIEDCEVRGRKLRNITLLLVDGGNMGLTINHSDLALIESAVGSFVHPEF